MSNFVEFKNLVMFAIKRIIKEDRYYLNTLWKGIQYMMDLKRKDNDRKSATQKIAETLFEARKDFIVLGLCGKTGSGVTTLADALKMPFGEWGLPYPGKEFNGEKEKSEYRIIYNFAKQNWKKFHKIKVSSLITATILEYDEEKFWKYLKRQLGNAENIDVFIATLKDNVSLFNCNMQYNWEEFKKTHSDEMKLIERDHDLEIIYEMLHIDKDNRSNCNIQIEGGFAIFPFKFLQNLFQSYLEKRKKTGQYESSLVYYVLYQYLFDELPRKVDEFWKFYSENCFRYSTRYIYSTVLLQEIGRNLRLNGEPYNAAYNEDTFQSGDFQFIAKRINSAIKIVGDYTQRLKQMNEGSNCADDKKEEKTTVVIDSIKNLFESMYLKDRYSNYYLIAIYTEESQRINRLELNRKWNRETIEIIDNLEQFSKLKKRLPKEEVFTELKPLEEIPKAVLQFIVQNVEACIEAADIFINNDKDSRQNLGLKKKILRYISLMMSPGLVLPTDIERCMQIAFTAKVNSGCISRQVGAVITDNKYHLCSVGWNQQPEDHMPCSYRNLIELYYQLNPNAYSDFENDDYIEDGIQQMIGKAVKEYYDTKNCPLHEVGKECTFCFKELYAENDQVYPRALHAEETAFLNLADVNRYRIKGGFLFTTASPCVLCSKKAMYLGISKIYYIEPYPGISFNHILSAGPKDARPEIELFTGAIGRAYTQLYTPIFPKKDELELWLGHKICRTDIKKAPWRENV